MNKEIHDKIYKMLESLPQKVQKKYCDEYKSFLSEQLLDAFAQCDYETVSTMLETLKEID